MHRVDNLIVVDQYFAETMLEIKFSLDTIFCY